MGMYDKMSTLKTKKSTQPSRKGKKAWRKNVDITEIEETLEEIRNEERVLGGKIQELPTEKLFFIDTQGDVEVQKKIKKRLAKLRIDQILESRSKIPPVYSKPLKQKHGKKTSKFTEMSVEKSMQSKYDKPDKEVVLKSGEYDIWLQDSDEVSHPQKKRKIKPPPTLNAKPAGNTPAVRIPHPGSSYMPEAQAHQELLMIAHKEEETKLLQWQRIKSQIPPYTVEISTSGDAVCSDKGEDSDLEENDGNENGENVQNKVKDQRQKTKAERRKQKKIIERLREEERRKAQKDQKKKLERLPEIIDKVEQEFDEHEKKLIERKRLAAETKNLPKSKIGKYRVRKTPTDVLLSDELKPTFRQFKPEGNLFRERMVSYEERNIVEPRVRVRYD
ncbi:9672_t:CDS:2 [Acaulospora colombiana]|uniref:9672_t:CDS:1 n=1 Tax=Acaulospora colombiana TaxID=27376 RepID=A0ACA9L7J7_9GLOM|nr:9672_t:CDS:2 [Acaulospora colombiana]